MIAVPKENVPDWMKGAKEAADGVKEMALKIMKDGPVVIVESIGQGFMDQIQSPEGIAAVAGTVTGMLAGGMAGKKINTKLSAGKGSKVDGIDGSKGASGTGLKYGDTLGKTGTYVKNPKTKIDWSKVSKHGFERMTERGVTRKMIESWVKKGEAFSQSNGSKYLFFTKDGAVVVASDGTVIILFGK